MSEPEDRVAAQHSGPIPATINTEGMRIAMVHEAIDLNDEPSLDQQVHCTDATHSCLRLDREAKFTQDDARVRFTERLGRPGHMTSDPRPPRRRPSHKCQDFTRVDQALGQGCVKKRYLLQGTRTRRRYVEVVEREVVSDPAAPME